MGGRVGGREGVIKFSKICFFPVKWGFFFCDVRIIFANVEFAEKIILAKYLCLLGRVCCPWHAIKCGARTRQRPEACRGNNHRLSSVGHSFNGGPPSEKKARGGRVINECPVCSERVQEASLA